MKYIFLLLGMILFGLSFSEMPPIFDINYIEYSLIKLETFFYGSIFSIIIYLYLDISKSKDNMRISEKMQKAFFLANTEIDELTLDLSNTKKALQFNNEECLDLEKKLEKAIKDLNEPKFLKLKFDELEIMIDKFSNIYSNSIDEFESINLSLSQFNSIAKKMEE